MPQACTIYCVGTTMAEIVTLGESLFGEVSVVGSRERWSSLTVRGMSGEMIINSQVFQHNGDEFSSLRLSTYMTVKNVESADEGLKKRVLKHVEATELVLGIVATPSLDADDRYHQFVFEIARMMDGLIFDGNEFLDPEGTTLIEL